MGSDKRDDIIIKGARENNLKGVSLRIPKGELTVFTGVSGSGKSSLLFDTIAIESKRQLNETFPLYVQNRMPRYEAPRVDFIDNLSTAIVVDQHPLSANVRSTVGTAADVAPIIRLLFSRFGTPCAGYSNAYSFNDPQGMCPVCGGLGRKASLDMDKFLDPSKSLNEGAIRFPIFSVGTWQWQTYANSGLFDCDKPLNQYNEKEWEELLHGKGMTVKIANSSAANGYSNLKYEGLIDRFERIYLNRDIGALSKKNRDIVLAFIGEGECPACHGRRLNQAALQSRLCGYNIAEMGDLEVSALIPVLNGIGDPVGSKTAGKAVKILKRIVDIGLPYLTLNRPVSTLSGGESQRLKMVRHLGSSLTGLTYIFDEPSAGLHPRDVSRLNDMLFGLRERRNTVLVVEHDRDVILAADQVVEMGPGAGKKGGEIVFQGKVEELLKSDAVTGRYLRKNNPVKENPRPPKGYLTVENADRHNLKNITVRIPMGVLTVVTGVAGSGKSTLVFDELPARYPETIRVDQSPIGTNVRSTPATYIGIMDEIRSLFAKANKVGAGLFSFNSTGACPVCRGKGEIVPDMAFMDPVAVKCEACQGKRYSGEALKYRLRGKTILEALNMTVNQALEFFTEKKIADRLKLLKEVGMGYVTLGQSTASLSGGECQRVKLAEELHKKGSVYVMDEPTTGLHMADVETLLALLNRLVDLGNTVVVVEHNQDVIKQADWVIDLGPEGGRDGGSVLFTGTPAQLLKVENSYTARFLRENAGI